VPTRVHRTADLPGTRDHAPCRTDVDHLPVAVLLLEDSAARYANDRWRELTGQRGARWRGTGWLQVVEPSLRDTVRLGIEACALAERTYDADWSVQHPALGGRVVHVTATSERAMDGRRRVLLVAHDVTDERARTAQLLHLANHDPLTGLRNRRQFLEFVERAAADQVRGARTAAVIFVDVDDLKGINDRYGHVAGDRHLVAVARCIANAVRPGDVVARWGGDEFVVLCEDLPNGEEAREIAERVRRACRGARAGNRRTSVSTGVALVLPQTHAEGILRTADREMYRSKREGQGPPAVPRPAAAS